MGSPLFWMMLWMNRILNSRYLNSYFYYDYLKISSDSNQMKSFYHVLRSYCGPSSLLMMTRLTDFLLSQRYYVIYRSWRFQLIL